MFCLLALFLIALGKEIGTQLAQSLTLSEEIVLLIFNPSIGATADEEIDFDVEIEYETGKKYIIHPGPVSPA